MYTLLNLLSRHQKKKRIFSFVENHKVQIIFVLLCLLCVRLLRLLFTNILITRVSCFLCMKMKTNVREVGRNFHAYSIHFSIMSIHHIQKKKIFSHILVRHFCTIFRMIRTHIYESVCIVGHLMVFVVKFEKVLSCRV